MIVELIFLIIALLLFFGFFGEIIFEKTKIPDVIWLMLMGIIMGPVLNFTSSDSLKVIAPLFTTFALIYLLFDAGINTDIKSFLKSAPRGLVLSILSFVFSFAIVFGIGLLIGFSVPLALLLGTILSGISSAVVIPIINGMSGLEIKTKLSLMFDSAFSDVLCILGTVTIVQILTLESNVSGLAVVKDILSSFLIAIAFGLIAAFIWNRILEKINNHNIVLTLAFMLFVFSITQLIGANGAIASLVFGLVLGNSKKIASVLNSTKDNLDDELKKSNRSKKKSVSLSAKKVVVEVEDAFATESSQLFSSVLRSITKHSRDVYGELAFTLKTFFFVYLGILIDFSVPKSFLLALLLVVGLYLVRPFAVLIAFDKSTHIKDINLLSTLIPKGLAAAVLVQIPIQAGITGAESLVNVVLAVILISILLSSIMAVVSGKDKFKGFLPFLFRKFRNDE